MRPKAFQAFGVVLFLAVVGCAQHGQPPAPQQKNPAQQSTKERQSVGSSPEAPVGGTGTRDIRDNDPEGEHARLFDEDPLDTSAGAEQYEKQIAEAFLSVGMTIYKAPDCRQTSCMVLVKGADERQVSNAVVKVFGESSAPLIPHGQGGVLRYETQPDGVVATVWLTRPSSP